MSNITKYNQPWNKGKLVGQKLPLKLKGFTAGIATDTGELFATTFSSAWHRIAGQWSHHMRGARASAITRTNGGELYVVGDHGSIIRYTPP